MVTERARDDCRAQARDDALAELCAADSRWFREMLDDGAWDVRGLAYAAMSGNVSSMQASAAVFRHNVLQSADEHLSDAGWPLIEAHYQSLLERCE